MHIMCLLLSSYLMLQPLLGPSCVLCLVAQFHESCRDFEALSAPSDFFKSTLGFKSEWRREKDLLMTQLHPFFVEPEQWDQEV